MPEDVYVHGFLIFLILGEKTIIWPYIVIKMNYDTIISKTFIHAGASIKTKICSKICLGNRCFRK